MIQFVLTNFLFISIGGIIYIIIKTLPKIEDNESQEKIGVLDKFIISDLPHQIDKSFNFYLGKILRKTKVLVLKLDNYLGEKLKNFNSGENGSKKIDFSNFNNESTNEKKEENTLLKD